MKEEPTAFVAFVMANQAELLRTAHLLTGNAHDAQDLVQSTLVRALVHWQRVTRAGSPKAYVTRMLATGAIDRHRRSSSLEILTDAVEATFVGKPARDCYSAVDDRERLRVLLQRLPQRQRAVLVLRYYCDLKETEVADVLNVSVGTVKSQASKACAKVRQYLTEGEVRHAAN